MFYKNHWLQFFAEGAGGDGTGAGVTPGDAGRDAGVTADDAGQRLEALGVPLKMAEQYQQRKAREQAQAAAAAAPQETTETEAVPPESQKQTAENVGWDEFMARPENQQRLQTMLAARGRQATAEKKRTDETMTRINPMIALLAENYGLKPNDDGAYDLEAVSRAVLDDDRFYERFSDEMGVSSEVGKRLAQLEREKKESDAARAKAERDEQLRQYFYGMARQAEEMKQIYPDFDLQREMNDPAFQRLVDPNGGRVSVKQAFWAVHGDELAQRQAEAITRQVKMDVAASVRAGQRMPRENGGSTVAAVSSTPNLKKMNAKDRIAYIKAKYPPR